MKSNAFRITFFFLFAGLSMACRSQIQSPTATQSTPDGVAMQSVETPTVVETPSFTTSILTNPCDDPLGCIYIEPEEPLQIATALSLNGILGLDVFYGVEIAVAKRDGVYGHDIVVKNFDSKCSAEGGELAARRIASDPKIAGVIGTGCSNAGVPASQILGDLGYTMISPSNTAPVLTDPATRAAGYFRTAHNDLLEGRAVAQFAYYDLGLRRAAAIHDGDPYTEGLAGAFRDRFEILGGTVVAFEAADPGANDVTNVLDMVDKSEPEFLFFPVFANLGTAITIQSRQVEGLTSVVLIGGHDIRFDYFLEAAGTAAEGMYVSGPDVDFQNPQYAAFIRDYHEMYGTEPIGDFHAHAYDAINILLDAVEMVAEVGDDGSLIIGRLALREAVAATVEHEGLTGLLSCDPNGDCGAGDSIIINQVQNVSGILQFVPVE